MFLLLYVAMIGMGLITTAFSIAYLLQDASKNWRIGVGIFGLVLALFAIACVAAGINELAEIAGGTTVVTE